MASDLRAEHVDDGAAVETSPVISANPTSAYVLLTSMGYLINVAILVGIGVYCTRNRRQYEMNYDSVN